MNRLASSFFISLILCLLTGCSSIGIRRPGLVGASYHPKNIFSQSERLPDGIRRVAVLPLAYDSQHGDVEAGAAELKHVLETELRKAQRFELTIISPEQCKLWTGRPNWSAKEKLPPDFFTRLNEHLGCDAVLFVELSDYRAYPPLTVGWDLRLVDVNARTIIWAADEIFDAADPAVATGARRYQLSREHFNPILVDSRQALISTRCFGEYTVETLIATLPAR